MIHQKDGGQIGKTISHYKIIEKIGEGGMGIVYKAQDLKLDRFVALKFLPQHLTTSDDEKQRFIHEAKAASSLDHTNICNIYEIDETRDGQLFIAMAYYEGAMLDKKIEDILLTIEESIDIAMQNAQGLAKAHEKEIIHRDIKPANIMVTNDGVVKILDFGLAKLSTQTKLTKESTTLGTVSYMSPEQAKGEDVDYRTDIWSLGVILYEMLTGQLPFKGEYESAVIYSIINETQEPVTALRTGVPMELEQFINKCLNKNPSDRYQHVDDLIVDLRQLKEQLTLKTSQTKPETSATKKKSRLFISSLFISILVFISILYFIFFKTTEDVSSLPERKKLVVLPFKNLGLPEDEYFADGITEEITSRLSEIKQLGVIGRTSADRYKNTGKTINQIGEELGVDYLLEGSVRWEKFPGKESRIRVTPQLIKVSDGTHIWTKRYDAILESVFEVQSDIAEKVAKALDITLLGAEQKSISQKPTENLEAYESYFRGYYYQYQRGETEENFSIAEKMYLKAVGLDSNFVFPYIKLAQINLTYYWQYWDRNKSRLTRTKYYIDKAIEINPDIPEIYVASGMYYYQGFLDYNRALIELENGLKISPDNGEMLEWIGYIKRRQGKFKEAISYLIKSSELNPRSLQNAEIGVTYLLLKKYEKAEKYVDIAISSIPEDGWFYYIKALIHIFRNGDVKRAFQILKGSLDVVNQQKMYVTYLIFQISILEGKYAEALKMLSDEPAYIFDAGSYFVPKSQFLAKIYGLQNNKNLEKIYYDSAKIVIESKLTSLPDDPRLHSALGIVLAGLGKKDEAIIEGIRATELLPITKEAWRGFTRELDLAKIYTMVGEYDLAIDKLEYLLSIPGELSVPYIKLDPVWQPLLKIPRFQKILEENK
jgi:non-specific serine/threonine protein kinase